MTYPKKLLALAGILILKRGIITINYWVLIIAHSWLRDADIKMLMTKLDAMATFELSAAEVKAA